MTGTTLKIYGSKRFNDDTYGYENKIFKTLKQFEKWIGKDIGIVQALSFKHGLNEIYCFGYKNGKRVPFYKNYITSDWKNWFQQNKSIA